MLVENGSIANRKVLSGDFVGFFIIEIASAMEARMQTSKELFDAINRINDSTNFLAQQVIDIRDQINGARTQLSDQEWQAMIDRLTTIIRVLERIGNDPNNPAPMDLPTG